MTLPWYTTREAVKVALDSKATARSDKRIDEVLAYASRQIELPALGNRRYYPTVATRYKDWPNEMRARSWVLWLGADELISATTVTSGGTAISASDYNLEPVNSGPPYNRIEINRGTSAAWSSTANTPQRSIAITGVFGYDLNEATAGTAAEAVDASETGVDISDSSLIGVGDLIKIDSERMIVTGKNMLDTGQNCTALTAANNDVAITGITAGTIAVGETILVDSERMYVVDIAGTTVTVKRAWDGSVLAAHSNGADIYAQRTLTVARGVLGTTAATHSTSAQIYRHVWPAPVSELCLALACSELLQGQAGWGRTAGSGDNERELSARGLAALKKEVIDGYRRNRPPKAV